MTAIVRVGADGADELSTLHGQCFDQIWSDATFRRLIDHRGTFALVVRTADGCATAAGFALVRVVGEECELLTLGVVPTSCRQGIAAQLLASALDRAAIAGATAMILEVAEDNIAARGLYDAFSFEPIGRRLRYYSGEVGAADAITMKKTLGD